MSRASGTYRLQEARAAWSHSSVSSARVPAVVAIAIGPLRLVSALGNSRTSAGVPETLGVYCPTALSRRCQEARQLLTHHCYLAQC